MAKSERERNEEKLNECKGHLFEKFSNKLPQPFLLDIYGICNNCGGFMKVSDVINYCKGYRDAGGDLSEVIPNGIK